MTNEEAIESTDCEDFMYIETSWNTQSEFRKKAEVVISQLRADRDRLAGAIEKMRAEIIEESIEEYKYFGCGSKDLIIDTSLVLEIIDKHTKESDAEVEE